MSESSSGLWKPGLRNELTNADNCFLLLDSFDAMFNLLIIMKKKIKKVQITTISYER